jgi:hypothetical protein
MLWRQFLRLALSFALIIVLVGMIAWGTLAIYYSNLISWLRIVLAALFVGGSLILLLGGPPHWPRVFIFLTAFVLLVMWWLTISPSNDRDRQPDVAVLPWAENDGEQVIIHNIRNCNYRTETEYEVHHYDRTYDLSRLGTVDLFLVYWGSPLIAHTMLSFGFGQGGYVCISIEIRKEQGETYSALKGIFKQYELTYVVADERDVVRLRTNYRGEKVYLYQLQARPELIREVFLDYLVRINSLKQEAEWYNALTSNCTTNIRGHTCPYVGDAKWDWRILLNGYVDQLAYDRGALDRSLPFVELKPRSLINVRAQAADPALDFSRCIRDGLPGVALR